MRHQKSKKNVIIASVAALSLTLMGAACGSDEDDNTPNSDVPTDSIITPGSDTVTTLPSSDAVTPTTMGG